MENRDILQVSADILSEFLEVAFHNILYVCNVYPAEAFEKRRKYNVPVQMALHPGISSYISNSMTTIHKLLQKNEIEKVVISILNSENKPLKHFVFEINIPSDKELDKDFNFIDVELALRALCLKINISDGILESNSDENTFRIYIHTRQMTAISLAMSDEESDQEFPWIEAEIDQSDLENGVIVPIKTAETQIAKEEKLSKYSFLTSIRNLRDKLKNSKQFKELVTEQNSALIKCKESEWGSCSDTKESIDLAKDLILHRQLNGQTALLADSNKEWDSNSVDLTMSPSDSEQLGSEINATCEKYRMLKELIDSDKQTFREKTSFIPNLQSSQNQSIEKKMKTDFDQNKNLCKDALELSLLDDESSITINRSVHNETINKKTSKLHISNFSNKDRHNLLKDILKILKNMFKQDIENDDSTATQRNAEICSVSNFKTKHLTKRDQTVSENKWRDLEETNEDKTCKSFVEYSSNFDDDVRKKKENIKHMQSSDDDVENEIREEITFDYWNKRISSAGGRDSLEKSEEKESPQSILSSFNNILTISRERTFPVYALNKDLLTNRNLPCTVISVPTNPKLKDSQHFAKFQVSKLSQEYETAKPRKLEEIIKSLSPLEGESKSEESSTTKLPKYKVQSIQFVSHDRKYSVLSSTHDSLSQESECIRQPTKDVIRRISESEDTILIVPPVCEFRKQKKWIKNPEDKKWLTIAEEIIQILPSPVINKPMIFIFPGSHDNFHKHYKGKDLQSIIVPPSSQINNREIEKNEIIHDFSIDQNQTALPIIDVMSSESKHTLVKVDCQEPIDTSVATVSFPTFQKTASKDLMFPFLPKLFKKQSISEEESEVDTSPIVKSPNIEFSEVPIHKVEILPKATIPPKPDIKPKMTRMKYVKPKVEKKKGDLCYYGHEMCEDVHLYSQAIVTIPEERRFAHSLGRPEINDRKYLIESARMKYLTNKTNDRGKKLCCYGHEICEEIHLPSYVVVTVPKNYENDHASVSKVEQSSSPHQTGFSRVKSKHK